MFTIGNWDDAVVRASLVRASAAWIRSHMWDAILGLSLLLFVVSTMVFSLSSQNIFSPTSINMSKIHSTRIEDPLEPSNKTVSKGVTYY